MGDVKTESRPLLPRAMARAGPDMRTVVCTSIPAPRRSLGRFGFVLSRWQRSGVSGNRAAAQLAEPSTDGGPMVNVMIGVTPDAGACAGGVLSDSLLSKAVALESCFNMEQCFVQRLRWVRMSVKLRSENPRLVSKTQRNPTFGHTQSPK